MLKGPIILSLIFSLCCFWSCEKPIEIVEEIYQPNSSHEAYQLGLTNSGVVKTALGKDWPEAAESSLQSPLFVATPFQEEFYVDPAKVNGTGFRIAAKRGHKIEVSLEVQSPDSILVFIDAFRVLNDSLNQFLHIASAPRDQDYLAFEPHEDADYIIRVQNELLRGGRFTIKILTVPSLAFPVSGKTNSAIGSLFGAPRDGGKRKHHGIDIFARRHTPLIASTDGIVRSTKGSKLGGNVVWLRDKHRYQTLYYAHLEDVFVERGMEVAKGDTIGTVGNSGNARTTPPHLHFGIYSNGPVDPYPFVAKTRMNHKKQLAYSRYIGQDIRLRNNARIKLFGQVRNTPSVLLQKDQIATVIGISGSYYRVELPNLQQGYLFYDDIEEINRPLRKGNDIASALQLAPSEEAPVITYLAREEQYSLLGYSNEYWYVESQNGLRGWVKA